MEISKKLGSAADMLNALEATRNSIRGFATMLLLSLESDEGALSPHAMGVAQLLERQEQDLEGIEDGLREEFATLQQKRFQDQRVRDLLISVGIDNDEPDVIRQHLLGYFGPDGEDGIAKLAGYLAMDVHTVKLVLSCAIHPKSYLEVQASGENLRRETRENFRRSILAHLDSEEIHRVARKFNLDDDTVYSVVVDIAAPTNDNEQEITPLQPSSETLAERLKAGVDTAEIAQALNLKQATVERVIAQLVATPAQDGPDQQAVNG